MSLISDANMVLKEANRLKVSINNQKRRVRDGATLGDMYKTSKANTDALPKLNSRLMKESGGFYGHYGHIYALDWLGDNQHFVSAAQDGHLIVWNAMNGLKTSHIRLQSNFVMACAAEKTTHNMVAVGGLDHLVSIYKLSDYDDGTTGQANSHSMLDNEIERNRMTDPGNVGIGNPIQNQGDANTSAAASGPRPSSSSSPSPSGQLGTLGISDDDSYTYSDAGSINADGRMSSITLRSAQLTSRIGKKGGFDEANMVLHGHEGFISGLGFSNSGRNLLSVGNDNMVALWDTNRGECIENFHGHTKGITCCAYQPGSDSDNIFATGSADCTLKIWDKRLRGGNTGTGSTSVGSGRNESNDAWGSVSTRGSSMSSLEAGLNSGSAVGAFAARHLTEDENDLVDNLCNFQTFKKNVDTIECLAWFPDGNAIATGSVDSTVRVYDMRCCGQLAHYVGSGTRTPVRSLEFSASGRFLFTGYSDSNIRVFDLTQNRSAENPVATLTGAKREVRSIKRSDDGSCIISGGLDGKIRLYT
jgi:WD40 repeat protein